MTANNLMPNLSNDSTAAWHRITTTRNELLERYKVYIASLEEADDSQWAIIVKAALEAGLDKELLCAELSCAWSTILRWAAGQTVPGAITRRAIKAVLIELLSKRQLEKNAA